MAWLIIPAIVGGAIGVLVWKRRGNPGTEDFDVNSLRDVGGMHGDALNPGSGSVAGRTR
ncbi:MAG: hypothetical protein LCI03_00915 [Actinobacteria bacterium]|jgi:hypothetical protein|nr:hypothetical protein [Actinomycetota bacterium]